ncbi:hypothetical protein KY360_01755 [Candidatus Woesearchaeota archaeon]|nr:hypothetical protein [Candidatus Woesearchaeota archaeon]
MVTFCGISIVVGIGLIVAGVGGSIKIKNKIVGVISGSTGGVLIALGILLGVLGFCS